MSVFGVWSSITSVAGTDRQFAALQRFRLLLGVLQTGCSGALHACS